MPEFIGSFKSRISIAAFLRSGQGLIAGLLAKAEDGQVYLEDSSDRWPWPKHLAVSTPELPAWVAVQVDGPEQASLVYQQTLKEVTPDFLKRLDRRHRDRQRLQLIQQIRAFFLCKDFLEVDTPIAVANPGMEPYLDTFKIGDLWLRTSPELHMKQLLGLGHDRIFQMGPCFRKGDRGSIHREEFHMLEWYRCFADLGAIIQDLSGLLAHLAPYSNDASYFVQPPEVISCKNLFKDELGIQLTEDIQPLRDALHTAGIQTDPEDDWDTLYFLLFLNFIEPKLGQDRPTIVTDYPASQAALAKTAPKEAGAFPTCYRLELYIKGMELANAFYELTDGNEQRDRFLADTKKRMDMKKPTYPFDESFLKTLDRGLPPSAGIALGVDRLIAALLGEKSLDKTLPFP